MPRATLEFNLPEEREEFDTAAKAMDYRLILSDYDEHLRQLVKYETEALSEETYAKVQELRDKLWDLIRVRNVSL